MIARALPPALCLFLCLAASPPACHAGETEWDMARFRLVLFHEVPGLAPIGEREVQALQEGHLELLRGLYEQGRVLASGPVTGGGSLRSVLVLDIDSAEEARKIVDSDPWVTSGRRAAEIHGWWAARGILRQPAGNILHGSRCTLGLLERPEGAPEYPEEKLQEIQAGHRENIDRMWKAGDLVLSGPIEGDGDLRGILIFRATDGEKLAPMVAADPAVKAGTLGVRLLPWRVPAGTIPPTPSAPSGSGS